MKGNGINHPLKIFLDMVPCSSVDVTMAVVDENVCKAVWSVHVSNSVLGFPKPGVI